MTASASTTPSSFSAMQRYRPPSTAVTDPTESAPLGNRRVEDGNEAEDGEECTRTQEMEGVGWPVAAHSRMTVSPTMTSVSVGVRVMLRGVGAEVGSAGGVRCHLNVQANHMLTLDTEHIHTPTPSLVPRPSRPSVCQLQ